MRWGLIPSWAKDMSIGARMINARAETLAEKPTFRTALRRRRCLVLADGFYKWRKAAGSKAKRPMRIVLKTDEPFAFAGLWEEWRNPDGIPIQSCTIITTTPNELLAPIHDRIPSSCPGTQSRSGWTPPSAIPACWPTCSGRIPPMPWTPTRYRRWSTPPPTTRRRCWHGWGWGRRQNRGIRV